MTIKTGFREVALVSFLFVVFSMAMAMGSEKEATGCLAEKTEAGLSSELTQDPMLAQQSDIDFNTLIVANIESQAELNQKILEQTEGVQEAFEFERKYRHPTQSDRIRRTADYTVENKSQDDVKIVLVKRAKN